MLALLALAAIGYVGWWVYAPRSQVATTASTAPSFQTTVENARPAVGTAPPGMVWVPGGEFSMGAAELSDMNMVGMQATTDSRPVHRVYVDGFWMDTTIVTNAQFAAFVEATGYVTIAERTPRAEDFPGAPPENLVAGAVVFSPPDHPVPLNNRLQWWSYVKGANWRHPEGRRVASRAEASTPWCKSRTTMRWRLQSGQANACPRKQSGSSPLAAG
jgi:formylglycine-generating enzyme required for sulfatase activity